MEESRGRLFEHTQFQKGMNGYRLSMKKTYLRAVMKKFIFRLFLFLMPPALLLGAAEIFLRSQPNSYAVKQAAMERMAPRLETLILGASHTYMGVNPAYLGMCALNMAGVSQTIDVDLNMLRSYLPQTPKLKTVITNLDNAIFFDAPLAIGGESFRCTYYNIYMRMERIDRWPRKAFEVADWNGASERMKQILFKENFAVCDSLGWYSEYKVELRDPDAMSDETARRRNDNHTCRDWNNPVRNWETFKQLAALCRENNIRLIVLQTPVSEQYRKYIPQRQKEMVTQTLEKCRKMDGVVVADYSADKRFTDGDFYNTDHLSDKGAVKFSKILSTELGL